MGPEIIARLGLNREKYTKGLADAEKDFQNFASKTSGHGRSASEQLTHSFRGVHEVLKAFGAITAFKEFIGWFKELSQYAKEFGDKTDENTKAAVRWGDALKGTLDGVKKAGVEALGYLTQAGEGLGALGRFLGGDSLKDIRQAHSGEDAANAAEASRDAYKKANDPEKMKQLRKEIADINKSISERQLTDAQKVEELEKNQARIMAEKDKLGVHETEKRLELEKELAANSLKFADLAKKNEDEIAEKKKTADEKEKELHKQRMERIKELGQQEMTEEQKVQDLKDKLAAKKQDRSRMSLQELANIGKFEPGVSAGLGEQAEQGREAIRLRNQADQLRLTGDQAGADTMFSKSDEILHKLAGAGGPLRQSEDPHQSVQTEELRIANRHLQEIEDKITSLGTSN